jgi:hypothetical protein
MVSVVCPIFDQPLCPDRNILRVSHIERGSGRNGQLGVGLQSKGRHNPW